MLLRLYLDHQELILKGLIRFQLQKSLQHRNYCNILHQLGYGKRGDMKVAAYLHSINNNENATKDDKGSGGKEDTHTKRNLSADMTVNFNALTTSNNTTTTMKLMGVITNLFMRWRG